MITIADAEGHLRNRTGKITNDVQKMWEEFKSFAKETVVDCCR
jgi:hypothetical protein